MCVVQQTISGGPSGVAVTQAWDVTLSITGCYVIILLIKIGDVGIKIGIVSKNSTNVLL